MLYKCSLIYITTISSFQRTISEKSYDLSKPSKTFRIATLFYFSKLLRKEVIHPHVPVGIPCYDLTPITSPTLGVSLLAVRITTSSITSSHGLTGGVYKTRERIHRDMADSRLLAIPASKSRVADSYPN